MKAQNDATSVEDAEGWTASPSCPRCLSSEGQWRGLRARRRHGPIHRRCCKTCGRWFYSTLDVYPPSERNLHWKESVRLEHQSYDAWIESSEDVSRGH